MNYENFLVNVYFGSLDAERLTRFRQFKAEETTRAMIQKYLELNSEYPPSYLEEKGTVPADLLEKLRGSDFFGLTIPREYGGVGLSLRQYLYIVESLVSQNMSLGILPWRIFPSALRALFCLAMNNRNVNIWYRQHLEI